LPELGTSYLCGELLCLLFDLMPRDKLTCYSCFVDAFPVSSHSIDFPYSRLMRKRISGPISVRPRSAEER
jgi:hypothetical protein